MACDAAGGGATYSVPSLAFERPIPLPASGLYWSICSDHGRTQGSDPMATARADDCVGPYGASRDASGIQVHCMMKCRRLTEFTDMCPPRVSSTHTAGPSVSS
jgi:hypothetical protein